MNPNNTAAPPAPVVQPTAEVTNHPPTTSPPAIPPTTPRYRLRHWLIILAIVAAVVVGLIFAIPIVDTALNTISTDDAYVNGHVTFVAPRVSGQVKSVLTDDNKRVKAGQTIMELDPVPYQAIVNIKQANLNAAEADLVATKAQVTGLFGQLRSQRWKLQATMENVDNQIALLSARVATLESKKATVVRAEADLERAKGAFARNSSSKADLDLATEGVKVAKALADQALQEIYEVRASLGLPVVPSNGNLTDVPKGLNQTFSTVRQALADLAQILAQLGFKLISSDATPDSAIAEFKKQDVEGNIDRIIEKLIPQAPAIKQAEAKLLQAKRDLEQAQLNLSYCTIEATVDGVITRRNVNPGNNVQAAQQVMAIRSLTEIWIDANFKETQLNDLRIGQRVELFADAYGQMQKYNGRITGFTYGTGSTLALLPAQNATGNFVKVVQRLPVRIELEGYNPEDDTLYAGLSMTPYVYYKEPPQGLNAGQRLQDLSRTTLPGGTKR
jgi:membrane fusion protein (multidrug efflux system)